MEVLSICDDLEDITSVESSLLNDRRLTLGPRRGGMFDQLIEDNLNAFVLLKNDVIKK